MPTNAVVAMEVSAFLRLEPRPGQIIPSKFVLHLCGRVCVERHFGFLAGGRACRFGL